MGKCEGRQQQYIVRGRHGTHRRRAPAEEGDVWVDGRGLRPLRGTGVGLDEGP